MSEEFESLSLGLLPERPVNWASVVTSYLVQALLTLVLAEIAILQPARMQLVPQHLTYTPLAPVRETQRTLTTVEVKPHVAPPAPTTARLIVPANLPITRPHTAPIEPPKMEFPSAKPMLKPAVTVPKAPVQTGMFSAKPPTPTLNRAAEQVQTGGFGDPQGLTGPGNSEAHLTAASLG